MELKDLMKDEIYYLKIKDGDFLIKNEHDTTPYIYDNIKLGAWYIKKGHFSILKTISYILQLRLATFSEKEYFLKCEKAGKFIPQDQIPNNELLIQNLIIW